MAANVHTASRTQPMSANPLELLTSHPALSKPTETHEPFRPERRKKVRTHVHWPVLLFRNHGSEAVATFTENLSSKGFYCVSELPFSIGESLACALRVPTHDPACKEVERRLECKIQIVRVELKDGFYGIACRIEDYHFVQSGRA